MSEQTSQIIKRNGDHVTFDRTKIEGALLNAFMAVEGSQVIGSDRVHELVSQMSNKIMLGLEDKLSMDMPIPIEDIQNGVELTLMEEGHYAVARSYIIYREAQKQKRELQETSSRSGGEREAMATAASPSEEHVTVTDDNGVQINFDRQRIISVVNDACKGLDDVEPAAIIEEIDRNLFDGIKLSGIHDLMVLTARTKNESEPNYSYVAARLLQDNLRTEALSFALNI